MKPKLSDNLCFAIYSASNAITRAYRPLLEEFDLTYSQYLVLQSLWLEDGVSLKSLSEQVMLDPGSLTPVVKRLEAKGMLSRRVSEQDERRKVIALTEPGRALKKQACQLKSQLETKAGIESAQLDQLRDQCWMVVERLNRAGNEREA